MEDVARAARAPSRQARPRSQEKYAGAFRRPPARRPAARASPRVRGLIIERAACRSREASRSRRPARPRRPSRVSARATEREARLGSRHVLAAGELDHLQASSDRRGYTGRATRARARAPALARPHSLTARCARRRRRPGLGDPGRGGRSPRPACTSSASRERLQVPAITRGRGSSRAIAATSLRRRPRRPDTAPASISSGSHAASAAGPARRSPRPSACARARRRRSRRRSALPGRHVAVTRGARSSAASGIVALVRHRDHLLAESEREQQLGGVGHEADDAHGEDSRRPLLPMPPVRRASPARRRNRSLTTARKAWPVIAAPATRRSSSSCRRARLAASGPDRSCASSSFADFAAAIAFVNRVAELAEAANHHPDILVHGWNKVRLTLSTHSEGGLTDADFALAARRSTDRLGSRDGWRRTTTASPVDATLLPTLCLATFGVSATDERRRRTSPK